MSHGPAPVFVDVQATQSRSHGERGIARYVVEQAAAVERVAPGLVSGFLLNPRFTIPPAVEPLLSTGRVRWASTDPPRRNVVLHIASPFELDDTLDAVWPAAWRRARLVVTLYDLIPLVFPAQYLRDRVMRARYTARAGLIRCADLVLAVSESTRRDAVELLGVEPDRVRVIGAGVSPAFHPPMTARETVLEGLRRRLPELREGFLLCVGGEDFRKNLDRLVIAYAGLPAWVRAAHQLVITYRIEDEAAQHLRELAGRYGARDDLLLTGYVSDEVLRSLYQACWLFVFPSLYEGFGLPVAEAMCCGAPVVTSHGSSLQELVCDEAARFSPDDVESIREVLYRAATDSALIARLREVSRGAARRFSWDAVGRATAAAYRDLLGDARPAPVRRRPRIAVVTPYPPQPSGVAVYSMALLGRLSARCDVDCFVDGSPAQYASPPHPACRLYPAERLEARARFLGYDAVLYCMGNSEYHRFVLEAMRRVQGDVLAHDVRYTGYYAWAAANGGRAFADVVREMYGARLPDGPHEQGYLSTEDACRLGVWMQQEVLGHARRVFVHSRLAQEVMRLEADVGGRSTPVVQVPFGFPEPSAPARRTWTPGPRPVLATFGIVDAVKRTRDLIEALRVVRKYHRGASLTFIGPVAPREAAELRGVARALGLGDAVAFTGRVSLERYLDWMGRAHVAIQLRAASQGEASATVAEAMAHGVPTVVSGIGWMGELPDRAVLKVGPSADALQIGMAIADLLGDPERWRILGEAAAEHAREHTFDKAAAALLELLLCSGGPRAPH